MEIFKDIEGYEGLYQISNLGNVKSLSRIVQERYFTKPKNIKPTHKDSYKRISLCKSGAVKTLLLHRVIAKHFVDNPENKPQVNHKDGNKLNNSIENLEWCTESENRKHAFDFGLQNAPWLNKKGSKNPNSKICIQISKDGFLLGVYDSRRIASKENNIPESSINANIQGKLLHAGGYIWK